jgi:hypothetical protein
MISPYSQATQTTLSVSSGPGPSASTPSVKDSPLWSSRKWLEGKWPLIWLCQLSD